MLKLLRGAVTAAAFATGLSAMLAIAVSTGSSAAASDQATAQALRAGGLVIVLRHGATFPDKADTDPLNFDNIAAQRNLNEKGKMLAKQFGDALVKEGEASIFRPDNGSYKLLARIQMDEWPRIAAAAKPSAQR